MAHFEAFGMRHLFPPHQNPPRMKLEYLTLVQLIQIIKSPPNPSLRLFKKFGTAIAYR